MCPLDYSLCDRTVTIYHKEGGTVSRLVADGCYYAWEDHQVTDIQGRRMERRFVLIMPGSLQRVFPGDRVYDGIGPEEVDWERFLPVCVPGLSQAAYVSCSWWGGEICHVEAGRN